MFTLSFFHTSLRMFRSQFAGGKACVALCTMVLTCSLWLSVTGAVAAEQASAQVSAQVSAQAPAQVSAQAPAVPARDVTPVTPVTDVRPDRTGQDASSSESQKPKSPRTNASKDKKKGAAQPTTMPAPEPAPAPAAAEEIKPAEPAPAQEAKPVEQAPPVVEGDPFTPADIEAKARVLAEKPFDRQENDVPPYLLNLGFEQWKKLRFKADRAMWRDEGLPFELQFFHPGFIYNRQVRINVVSNDHVVKVPFNADLFDYNDEGLAERARQTPPDYAGFRLAFPLNRPDAKDEFVVFLGATYFRAVGKNMRYGLAARGVALNTASPEGEEFPYFREFWIVKPAPGANSITIYALMDAPSMTGVYRFDITPDTQTLMDVSVNLYRRANMNMPQKIGLAPLTSMFLFSETNNGSQTDYRPEVHDSDGLLALDNSGSWLWSPLANPTRLAVNTFPMTNPRGFGLIQRDANFDHYQDLNARYDQRPSLWVEPKGDWGQGRIELIEIPSREEIHDNIVAFWVPDRPRPVTPDGQQPVPENEWRYPATMSYAYRLLWVAPGTAQHLLGRAVDTRMVRSPKGDTVQFHIDFDGDALNALPADTGLSSVIEAPENAPIIEKQLVKNPVTGSWRLSFKAKIPRQDVVQSIISARDGSPRLRFKALLKKGENLPDPLTEKWIYDIAS